jgi:hypothetical protein
MFLAGSLYLSWSWRYRYWEDTANGSVLRLSGRRPLRGTSNTLETNTLNQIQYIVNSYQPTVFCTEENSSDDCRILLLPRLVDRWPSSRRYRQSACKYHSCEAAPFPHVDNSRLRNSLSHVLHFNVQRTPEFQPQPMLETKIDFGSCPVW